MNAFTRDDLKELMESRGDARVSIYMPAHRKPLNQQQDVIVLKNLLGEADRQLEAKGRRRPERDEVLEPARRLLEDEAFWQRQSDGLALFAAPGLFRSYRLPVEFEPLAACGGRFHVKPLIPVLTGDGRFFVIAVSQNDTRLIQATRFSAFEVAPDGLPASLAEALRYDDPESQLQFRTEAPPMGGRAEPPSSGRMDRAALFHGHGVGKDDHKDNLRRYFRHIDRGLTDYLSKEHAPLVFAGVEYLFPIYQDANTYPRLIAEAVPGNPDEMRSEEIHAEAWGRVEPVFRRGREQAAQRCAAGIDAGNERFSSELKRIVRAAHEGRVDTLFVAKAVQEWGRYDPENGSVHRHAERRPDSEDLLDDAAVQTLLKDGTVYAVASEEVPGGCCAAAILRF